MVESWLMITFSRSLRSLHADRFRPSSLAVAAAAVLLAGWTAWLLAAEVPVFAVTSDARIETLGAAHVVGAPVAGKVSAVAMTVGQWVEAGHALLTLERGRESSRLEEERAHLRGAEARLEVLLGVQKATIAATESARHGDSETIERAQALQREAASALRLAEAQRQRASELLGKGLLPPAELEEAAEDVEQKRAATDAAARNFAQLQWQSRQNEARAEASLAEIGREMAALTAELNMAGAASARLDHDVEERVIRAPVAGFLGEVTALKPGAVVELGDRVAVVIPGGEFEVVAYFAASDSLGRIRSGQPAKLGLFAYPWIRFGKLGARVERVSSEAADGRIRVELRLSGPPPAAVTIQHGLPGKLAVEVERVAPIELLLRVVGKRIESQSAGPARPEPS